ncbi:zinc ribbon domain-containing protein [Neobacillus niacini]|uniref:zinc ribbon domain-containing protein n=1 Tax=Neobacillus niacini TaxID=86668 RepID=UPI002FFF130F
MKYCKKCGNQLSSELKFCTKCGTTITSIEQSNSASSDLKKYSDEKEHKSTVSEKTPNIFIEQGNNTPSASKKDSNEKVHKSILSGEELDSTSIESRVKGSTEPTNRKKKVPKWVIGVVAAVILSIAGIAGVMSMNDSGEKKVKVAATEPKEAAETKPPNITQEDVTALFPDWQMIKQEMVNINGTFYTVLAIAKNEIEFEETVKIAVIDYTSKGKDNPWSSVWESEEYFADPMIDIESYIGDFYVLNPDNNAVALVVFNVMHGGSAQTYDTFAIQLDEGGTGEVAWSGGGSYIEEKENYIEVMVHGAVHLAVEKDKVKITEIPRSEVGSDNALKVEFTLNSDGLVVPTLDEEIYVKAGQPLTFVPADDKTKNLFDEGDISLYYNSMDNAPISTANVNLVYAGNEFTLKDEGSFGFLLDYYTEDKNYNTPPYTFIVHVGDGVKPAQSEKTEDAPSVSSEIEAPFPIGAPLSELKAHYGKPSYDGYYSGGRLISFDKEGYFIDELDETVIGYYFTAPTLSIFGATVGMTGEEINSIYSETIEPYLDETGSENYVHNYSKNGYKVFFHSKEEDGPTSSVWLVKEY